MKIVLDTNVLLVSLPAKSRYRPIFNAFLKEKFTLIVTTQIMLEYREIVNQRGRLGLGDYLYETIILAKNVLSPNIYFNWDLIKNDPDDNKFTDAYLASDSDYLVSNDTHFNILSSVAFPPVNVIDADAFLKMI